MVVTWFYFRILYLPWIIYGIFAYCRFPKEFYYMESCNQTMAGFLIILVILHLHWFRMFMIMGYGFLTSGKTKDLVNQVEYEKNLRDAASNKARQNNESKKNV